MTRRSVFSIFSGWFSNSAVPDSPNTIQVLNRNAERLMRLRGVMSVGLGRTADGRPAIVLGLENPLAVPENLPDEVEGIPVVHQDVGRPEVQD